MQRIVLSSATQFEACSLKRSGRRRARAHVSLRQLQQPPQRRGTATHHVCQRVGVEYLQEGFQRLSNSSLQSAYGLDSTAAFTSGEALDKVQIFLGLTYDCAEPNRRGRSAEGDAAASAAKCFDVAQATKVLNHLHQVSARDSVGLGDLRHRCQFVAFHREEHQNAQTVVAVAREVHGLSYSVDPPRMPVVGAPPFAAKRAALGGGTACDDL